MTCIWNGILQGWRINRSNKYHQKQFLNLDHWIQNPKSRKCNEHTWFVVRLRIGSVTASPKKLKYLNWRTIATWSHDQNMCTPRLTLKEQQIFTFEKMHAHKACATTSKYMCQCLGSTSSYPSSTSWNSFMPILSDPHIYQETMNLKSFSDCIHFIYRLAPWMPHNIGLLHVNNPYGMPLLQHYSPGQQIMNHASLAMS